MRPILRQFVLNLQSLAPSKLLPGIFITLALLSAVNATTLSDNLSATTEFTEIVTSSTWISSGFATDNFSYRLSSVTALMMSDVPTAVNMFLYSSSNSQPGKSLGMLSSPGSFSSNGLADATFGGNGLALMPDTTYWVVMSASGAGRYEWAYASDNTGTGAGFLHTWGISEDAGSSWFTANSQPMQMRIDATSSTATPEPGAWGFLMIGLGAISVSLRRRRARAYHFDHGFDEYRYGFRAFCSAGSRRAAHTKSKQHCDLVNFWAGPAWKTCSTSWTSLKSSRLPFRRSLGV